MLLSNGFFFLFYIQANFSRGKGGQPTPPNKGWGVSSDVNYNTDNKVDYNLIYSRVLYGKTALFLFISIHASQYIFCFLLEFAANGERSLYFSNPQEEGNNAFVLKEQLNAMYKR